MYLLDTVALSEMRKRDRNQGVTAWLADKPDNQLFISVISIGEITRGIQLQKTKDIVFANRLQQWLDKLFLVYQDRILPVTIQIAKLWGDLSAVLNNSGADILLAATALEYNLSIVTRNEKHFADTNIDIVNPWI